MTNHEPWHKQSYRSLVKLIQENRRMTKEFEKKDKGFRVAMISGTSVMAAYVLIFIIFGMRNMRQNTRIVAIFLCMMVFVIFIPLYVFIWYRNINKPKKDYIKSVKDDFPGLEIINEYTIKHYLWNLEGRELLYNLYMLIVWEGAKRKENHQEGDIYTPEEKVVLDVWRTGPIDQELYEYYEYGEHVRAYIDGAIESFMIVGAEEEAHIWKEVSLLLDRIQKVNEDEELQLKDEEFLYTIPGDYEEARFIFQPEDRELLIELRKKRDACREESEKKLYEYVLEHKDAYQFSV